MKHTICLIACLLFVLQTAGSAEATNSSVKKMESSRLLARPLPLNSVRLLGGPLKRAMDLDAEYLLQLEPDRMLAYYRERAGLKPKAKPYGGWDGGGRNLTGHIGGHYLSAVSIMYAATGDLRFKERSDYIVKEFAEIQTKHGDGYLSALEGGRECWQALARGEIRSGGFDLNGLWAPWYTLHKTFAGLRDAYRYCDNRTARDIEIRFAAWAEKILSGLNNEQIQRMLNTEFGGMNEVMVDLYADTGDRRWLDLSYKFEHQSFIDPLKRHQDILPGKHGNTQVPKLIGSADRYAYAGTTGDIMAASFFWDRVVQHHSFATGGHGMDEYFAEADKLNDRIDGRTAETCNVYNMLKLTRRLFSLRPDAHYADFLERALFNHILASIDPEDGRTCYMVPVGRRVRREYANMFRSFTCCVGSGMESHALHGEGIYYESGDKLWVNMYVPSTVDWTTAGVKLSVDSDFPDGQTTAINLSLKQSRDFTLALRRPPWAGEGFSISINGEPLAKEQLNDPRIAAYGRQKQKESEIPGYYIELTRTWSDGDRVEVVLPKSLRLEPLPDNPDRVAILWGPLALAGDLGPEPDRRQRIRWNERERVPVFVASGKPLNEWLKPLPGKSGHFSTTGVGREKDINFSPFYSLHRRLYAVYWDLFTEEGWQLKQAEYKAEQDRIRRLEEVTVAYAQPGEMQPERNFNYQGGRDTRAIRSEGRPGRRGWSWFSFDMPLDPDSPMALVITYYSGENQRGRPTFDILVDGKFLARQDVRRDSPAAFYDVEYPLKKELVQSKTKITIRFQTTEGNTIPGVYGIRTIRK